MSATGWTEEVERIADETITGPPPGTEPPPESEPAPSTDAHSWQALDLVAIGSEPPEPPAISGLLYPGRCHIVSGEFESGKSWILLAVAVDVIRDAGGVIWVDTDDMGASATLERLRGLGATDEQIRERFAYLRPSSRLTADSRAYLAGLIASLSVRLVVFDAFNATLALFGLDPNSTDDVERFYATVARPLGGAGPAVALPDHVVKRADERGRYSIGSERKATGSDVHLQLKALEPFGRGRTGKAKITVQRDRPGFLRAEPPSAFVLVSDPETGACSWRLEVEQAVGEHGLFRPTRLMEKVSRFLELAGEPCTRDYIEQGVRGKGAYIREAIDVLVAEGYASESAGPRGARLVTLLRAFREDADEAVT